MHQADLNLACYIACQSEISSMDHLGDVVRSAFQKEGKPQLTSPCWIFKGDLGALDAQYQAINFQQWKSTDVEQFWVEVYNFQDSRGEQCFKELVLFALSLLAMPLSNADVEQVFTREKSKHWNGMSRRLWQQEASPLGVWRAMDHTWTILKENGAPQQHSTFVPISR